MRPDLTKLVALADRGGRLRDQQLSRLAQERPMVEPILRRVLGRPGGGGR